MARKTGSGCRICQEVIHLCCYHAKHCLERECVVPFCRMAMMQRQSMQPPPQMPGQPMPPNMGSAGNMGQSHPELQ